MSTIKKDPVNWITIKGNHIPVSENETKREAVNNFMKNKELYSNCEDVPLLEKKNKTSSSKVEKEIKALFNDSSIFNVSGMEIEEKIYSILNKNNIYVEIDGIGIFKNKIYNIVSGYAKIGKELAVANKLTKIKDRNQLENLLVNLKFGGKITTEDSKKLLKKYKDNKLSNEKINELIQLNKDLKEEIFGNVKQKIKEFDRLIKLANQLKAIKERDNLEVSKSPYGESYYLHKEGEYIDWGDKPNKSYRLADHWNFTSKAGGIHCESDGEDKEWYIAKYSAEDGKYHKIK